MGRDGNDALAHTQLLMREGLEPELGALGALVSTTLDRYDEEPAAANWRLAVRLFAQPPLRMRRGKFLEPGRVPRRAPELPARMLSIARLMMGAGHRHRVAPEALVQRIEGAHQP